MWGHRYDVDSYRYPAHRGMRLYPEGGYARDAGYAGDYNGQEAPPPPMMYSGEFEAGYGSYRGGGYDRGYARGVAPHWRQQRPGGMRYGEALFGRGGYDRAMRRGSRSGYGRDFDEPGRRGGYDRGWRMGGPR